MFITSMPKKIFKTLLKTDQIFEKCYILSLHTFLLPVTLERKSRQHFKYHFNNIEVLQVNMWPIAQVPHQGTGSSPNCSTSCLTPC